MMTIITLLSSCTEQNQLLEAQKQEKELQAQFALWKSQNHEYAEKYERYLAKNLKNPPNLFDLSINRHLFRPQTKPECFQYRFSIVPESEWKNIIQPFKLMEKLQRQNIIGQYKITSTYRSPKANTCSRGAKASKHLHNYAVDFQLLDKNNQPLKEINIVMQQHICNFWLKHGKSHSMGLGTYQHNKFHIDTNGYRTWGITFKRDSSLCLIKH